MKPVTEPLLAVVARSLLAFTATYMTLLAWRGLSEQSSGYLLPLFWVGLALLLGGALARVLGVPSLVVAGAQVLLAVAGVSHWLAPSTSVAGWIPTGRSFDLVAQRLQGSVETANSWAAPIPAMDAPSFTPLMVIAGVAVFLLVDLFLGVARRAPLVGLPLLAAFTAPVSVLHGVSWVVFSLAALAYLLMLAVDQALRLSRWGTTLPAAVASADGSVAVGGAAVGGAGPNAVADDQPHQVRVGTLWPAASRLAVAGVGLAVVAPAVLPATSGLFNPGTGPGTGEGGISLQNPLVDMRRDLDRAADIPMVRVRTDDPAPAYLRTTVLDSFDGQAWRPSERELPRTQRVVGKLPPPPGLDPNTPVTDHQYSISVLDGFDTTWLPTPYPAQSVTVQGDWRYDLSTLDILSSDEDVDASGLTYEAVGMDVEPNPQQLVEAPPVPQAIYVPMTDLPSDLPVFVPQLARKVTENGRSQFERAVILQNWFRKDGGFTYSLDRETGSGLDQMEEFLGTGEGSRTGYCEQFAAAMAMMARALGIPARVVVGFLRPAPAGDGSWVYSSHDLHSWPELYFEGVGWLRFEPTPPVQTDSAPAYTSGAIPAPAQSDPTGAQGSDPIPKTLPGADQATRDRDTTSAQGVDQGPSPWWLILPAVLVVAALAAAPRVVRGWLRRRRYAVDRPANERVEGAWDELRATAIDLGLGWDDGATLRQRARALAPVVRRDPDALRALEAVVLGVERSRFSRRGVDEGAVEAVVRGVATVCSTMGSVAGDRARRQATWLPVSLWRGRSRPLYRYGAPASETDETAAGRRSETELVSV